GGGGGGAAGGGGWARGQEGGAPPPLRNRDRPDERGQGGGPGLDRSSVPAAPAGGRHGRDRRAWLRRAGRRSRGGRGEHTRRAQRDRVHAVLLLSVAHPGAAAGLVQGPPVPGQDGTRALDVAGRDGRRAAGGWGDPGGGLLSRGRLPGPAAAPAGDRGQDRGGAGRAGHAGFDDRRGAPVSGR